MAAAYCNALSVAGDHPPCFECSGEGAEVRCHEKAPRAGSGILDCTGYRIPTEAEWERAYRAGGVTAYHNGTNTATACQSCSEADESAAKIAWHRCNAGDEPHPVAHKDANAWGLFDMAGNVNEWCHDWYQERLGAAEAVDPIGAEKGTGRVLRGGSWGDGPAILRAASRIGVSPTWRAPSIGFRCVRTLP